MVFFNYSTMQMAAKVVYYGPGLCGKTTNLHHIYSQTSSECRGEMVSLETETDRTLFFDLLPIDVGQIAGFNTRIQLYTVPGQVFYNTTRKLVLKGVDGVVFVADSQRPMLQANVESLDNLADNLAEMGIEISDVPLVLQFNKRDLDDICTVEEMNQALNSRDWPWFEASALHGEGVFETLKGISKVTLMSLKRRLTGEEEPAAAERAPAADPVAAQTAVPEAPARPSAAHPAASAAPAPPRTPTSKSTPPPTPAPAPARAARAPAAKPATPPVKVRKTSSRNVLDELDRLRREAIGGPGRAATSANGSSELRRDIQLTLTPEEFRRARRFSLTVQIEDEDEQVVEAVRNLRVDLADTGSIDKLLLRLNIALAAKG